ncbi:MAG: hypothetical protein KDB71_01325 [Mycobacterium sp.]|nr:hypothetical protein [Mycobacterium sp.]
MTGAEFADIPTLARLTREAEAATGLVDMTTVRLAKLFEPQPTRRAHVVPGPDSRPAGWVAVRVDGCTGVLTADQCVFDGTSTASRTQVADELVELAGRMAAEIATASGSGEPVRLRFEVPRLDTVVRRALHARGARVVDTLARVRADINEVLRNSPAQPANVEVRRVETEDDFAAHHRIRNVGYAQLPDDRPLTVGQWRDQLLDEPGSAPDSWLLALVNGVPAGMLAASLSRAELGAVYIAHAATLPEARGSRCNYALNRVALTWGLAKGLTWSRSRCRADETLGVGVGEVNSRGYLVVDYLDIWEVPTVS